MSSPSISALTLGSSLSAAMQALTKKPMKPRRTPCFFSKLSLYSARSAMTWLMSTSLKVVSWAAVFCDSLRRSAMVLRSRLIATRSSRSARGRGPACTGAGAGRGGAFGGARFERVQHVALRDAAVAAGAGDARRIDAAFLRDAAHGRHHGRGSCWTGAAATGFGASALGAGAALWAQPAFAAACGFLAAARRAFPSRLRRWRRAGRRPGRCRLP